MVNIIVELSKYLIILFMIAYTYQCFAVFGHHDSRKKRRILRTQNVLMFEIHLVAFLVMYLQTQEKRVLYLYVIQVLVLTVIILLYTKIYPRISRLIVNNMCMLLLSLIHICYRKQSADTRSILLALNIADDYFKAKTQADSLENDAEGRDKEVYDLKHDLISTQIKYENTQKALDKVREENRELQMQIVKLETEIQSKKK